VPNTALTDIPIATLAAALDAALPQTQCTRCGYPDCRSYAQAIAQGEAAINRCPPGGDEGITRLAKITGGAKLTLDMTRGIEGPRALAVIDEACCIGCTLCIKACPVDCIVGASKLMHTVIDALCTGCELCVPACPVDCISMVGATKPKTGWDAWSQAQADEARGRYAFHQLRLHREQSENDERLAAKAQAKLDDLSEHSSITDPGALEGGLDNTALARQRARDKRELASKQ
jgi:Na+-translocating ferredoxin:NAD+ oxidoreductase subunit B